MKIGFTCYPTHGGSGVIATELGKLLAERGHEIHFITYDMPFRLGGFKQNIFYHEVEVSRYSLFKYPPYDLTLASRMAQVAKLYELDLLHVHYAVPHAVSAFLAKQMVGDHLKVVTTLHGTDITVLGEDPTLHNIICFGMKQSDAVTAVSESLKKQTQELFRADQEIERIYNFVDQRTYHPRNVRYLRDNYVCPDEKLIIHISNFRAVKRPHDVIKVFDKIQKQIPARLLLVGQGPEWSSVHELVQSLHLHDKVNFLGRQDDVAQFMSIADLLVLPSAKESFGLVALEAMACGVPTVGANIGGIPEVVIHGETGYLAELGDVDNMANDAIKILKDDAMHQLFVQNGLHRVDQEFRADRIVDQYEALYKRVLGEK
ncbi:N-acetyl-alpha-D-glucosaminyl L-malate synthase BshA [Shimazuella kribbensis]|uniref:N-acetyl-alpha-D-glucosaminyl L-malate synthase BshA n=1 Tax=Shimazuella kribbensis TaxID=139808 RepID=UPI0003FFF9B1|nr:N-acetyl-alpha-D-glucosaminyl L-malate synthase BshA [Shimazuella kribbensis]